VLSLLIWTLQAHAYIPPADPCAPSTKLIGTVQSAAATWTYSPGANPRYPDGRVGTNVTLQVERAIQGQLGSTITVRVPGGTLGTHVTNIPEFPTMEPGTRWALDLGFFQGKFFLQDWQQLDPAAELPSQSYLIQALSDWCSQ